MACPLRPLLCVAITNRNNYWTYEDKQQTSMSKTLLEYIVINVAPLIGINVRNRQASCPTGRCITRVNSSDPHDVEGGLRKMAPEYFEHKDKGKGKGFPYSIPSVGPGADPGVQAVSLQLPPQPQSITALWQVPSYTAW